MRTDRTIEDVLQQDGVFASITVGTSMYPMLRNRKDTIVIRPCTGRLRRYDVPLYKRGSDFILHRIVKVLPDAYVICGDNCMRKECDITDRQIIGVLTEFYIGDRRINMDSRSYKAYVRCWCALYPVRTIWKRGRYFLGPARRKIRGIQE